MTDQKIEEMREVFLSRGTDSFYDNHYELSDIFPRYSAQDWKEFLTEPKISDWLRSEMDILKHASLQKLLKNIEKSNSTGKAQLIAQLQKLLNDGQSKDGPIFIYAYVPLSEEQEQADNVIHANDDLFAKDIILQNTFKE